MAKYWLKWSKSSEVEGPFTTDQMREKASAGEINDESLVSPNRKNWIPARRVQGLFPPTPAIPVSAGGAAQAAPHYQVGQPIGTLAYASSPDPLTATGEPGRVRNVRWFFMCGLVMFMIALASFGPGVRRAGAAGFQSLAAPQRHTVRTIHNPAYGTYEIRNDSLADNPTLLAKFLLFLTAGCVVPLVSAALFIYFTVWVYQVHDEMRRFTDGAYPISPGQACGFCWIPLFNLYWLVYMPWVLANQINAYSGHGTKRVNAGGVIALSILAVIPGVLVGGLSLLFRGWSMGMLQEGLNTLWLNRPERTHLTPAVGRPF